MGVWNLNGPFLLKAPTTVFSENFETFSGWTTLTSGTVTQSGTRSYEGSFSGLRNTTNDPAGAYKLLTSTVNRLYLLDAWLYSVEPRVGNATDRIAIVNSSGNGYGFNIGGSTTIIERRDA
jgi:type IV pilus assembly protein PilY1